MKSITFWIFLSGCSIAFVPGVSGVNANSAPNIPAIANAPLIEISPYTVTERGPNHQVWQRVTAQTNTLGETIYQTNAYMELATGMHYWDGDQWADSSDQIQLTQNGAAATSSLIWESIERICRSSASLDLRQYTKYVDMVVHIKLI